MSRREARCGRRCAVPREPAEIALLCRGRRLVLQLGLDLALDCPQIPYRHPVRQVEVLEHPVRQLRGVLGRDRVLDGGSTVRVLLLTVRQRLSPFSVRHQGVVGIEVVAAGPDMRALLLRRPGFIWL